MIIYSIFGLNYSIELSTRPESFIGEVAVWDEAEKALQEACLATGRSFKINPGDGAFYGPKLDFKLQDSLGRIWQCGTVQLDMQLPGRFNCTYIAEDGSKKTPVMIHRACFGSLERFIGIITENYGGLFPLWLAPRQVVIIPVNSEIHKEYAYKVRDLLKQNNIKAEVDDRNEKLGYRMRQAQIDKIPVTLVVGDNEMANNTVNVRRHSKEGQVSMSLDELVSSLLKEIEEKK